MSLQWSNEDPLVSVIIPTRNSERTIRLCLASIFSQTYPRIETIVVDQHSRDETVNIVKHFPGKLATLPFGGIYLPPTRSRNFGSRISSGQYLLHVDSDMELTPGVVESCIEISLRGTKAVVIPEIDSYNNYWGRCKALERSCYLRDPIHETPRFFPTEIFQKIGGFDENLNAGEDWDIRIRLQNANIPIARTDHHLRHHIEEFDFFKNLTKKLNYARSFDKFQRKHPKASKQNLTIFRPALWCSRSKLAEDPAHALGLWIQKVAESYCTWVGMRRTSEFRETAFIDTAPDIFAETIETES